MGHRENLENQWNLEYELGLPPENHLREDNDKERSLSQEPFKTIALFNIDEESGKISNGTVGNYLACNNPSLYKTHVKPTLQSLTNALVQIKEKKQN